MKLNVMVNALISHKLRPLKYALVFVAMWVLQATTDVAACPLQLPVLDVSLKAIQIKLEVAATPEARKCGLSKRRTLPLDQGMLFVVPEPIILDFWMTGTQLPLSIAFVDDGGRILSIQKMQAMQTQLHYRSPKQVRYAIEMNRGWFTQNQIKVGDVFDFQLPMMMLVR